MTQQSGIVPNMHNCQHLFLIPSFLREKKKKKKPALCSGRDAHVDEYTEKLASGPTQVGTTQDLLIWWRESRLTSQSLTPYHYPVSVHSFTHELKCPSTFWPYYFHRNTLAYPNKSWTFLSMWANMCIFFFFKALSSSSRINSTSC